MLSKSKSREWHRDTAPSRVLLWAPPVPDTAKATPEGTVQLEGQVWGAPVPTCAREIVPHPSQVFPSPANVPGQL